MGNINDVESHIRERAKARANSERLLLHPAPIPPEELSYDELAHECYKEALNIADMFYLTPLQVLRTFSNVLKNFVENTSTVNICSETDNARSWFNQTLHGGKPVLYGHTTLEWGLVFGVIFPCMLGVARRIYIFKHDVKIKSTEYLLERLKEAHEKYSKLPFNINEAQLNKIIDEVHKKLIERNILRIEIDQESFPHQKIISDEEIYAIINERLAKNDYFTHLLANGRSSSLATQIKAFYDKVGSATGIFWHTCMLTTLVIGVTATLAPPYLTAVTLYSVISSVAINVALAIKRNLNVQPQYATELDKLLDSQKHIFTHLKGQHSYFLTAFEKILNSLTPQRKNIGNYKETFPKLFVEKGNNKRHTSIRHIHKFEMRNTRLGKHFDTHLHYSNERHKNKFIVSTLQNMVGHAAAVFFILWLVSSFFSGLAFIPTIATTMTQLGDILGSQWLGYQLAGIAFLTAGLSGYTDYVMAKPWYKKKVFTAGATYYKPEKTSEHEKYTDKRKAFNVLYVRTNQLKKELATAKQAILQARIMREDTGNTITSDEKAAEDFILNYKCIEVSNDDYFEEMTPRLNQFELFYKKLSRFLAFIGTSQTWIFIARVLAANNGPLAGIVANTGIALFGATYGALFGFVGFVAALGFAGGYVGLSSHLYDEDDRHKLEFINKLDARLSHLNKQYIQLKYVCELMNILTSEGYGNSQPNDNRANGHNRPKGKRPDFFAPEPDYAPHSRDTQERSSRPQAYASPAVALKQN